MALDKTDRPPQEDVVKIQNYYQQAASLLLYQSVLDGAIGKAFIRLLETLLAIEILDIEADYSTARMLAAKNASPVNSTVWIASCRRAYGQWCFALAANQISWQQYLIQQLLAADNPFSQQAQRLPATIENPNESNLANHFAPSTLAAARYDLAILHSLYCLPTEQIGAWLQGLCGSTGSDADDVDLPAVQSSELASTLPVAFPDSLDWTDAIRELTVYYRAQGVGLFGQFTAFRWNAAAGRLAGISTPDPIRLAQLVSYDHPKQQLIQNTEFLLQGHTAQNVLLYGSRGAGKSSLVKALLNEYRDRGLRLIEVPKADLPNLPQILEPLSQAPQKFIIFVDDLSFEDDDEDFKALKVVLEGGVMARPQNVVVYATSNRRHLIREFFDERPRPKDADEIQAWDTVQEKLSFSDRFGITLTFSPADQPTYLTIVRELAAQAGLKIEADNLDWRARQWATRNNGRSGRSARQFVDFLIAEQKTQ
ncbi:ATP-binding protein [cf. Phormidesmis sp. LEGE 11477]|uniref:ATP-binding protein n=1 Tax=cf. Phormidesmis sp. LEGE 11477 TaxID=1828680 RepID=UPI001881789D|nr:ATP-binding protein [cf. Phormidesmis sp. LEGE 11477]MBE9062168.1 ATP-binding protein [cf. Phormidesmis sp. LEGE 11477]